MQRKLILGITFLLAITLISMSFLLAQTPEAACDLPTEYTELSTLLTDIDPEANPDEAAATLYQLGVAAQELATRCGYQPSQAEREALADYVLSLVDIPTILSRNMIGNDIEVILAKLADTPADPITGQLLYNDLEEGADGTLLGCIGCHQAGGVAPQVEGTWTRFDEIYQHDPELEGYTFEQYIVESIVNPNAHISPDHAANLMPTNFGQRLTIEQLADLVAYLSSQDQLIE